MKTVPVPLKRHQSATAWAMNSGPSSNLTKAGAPPFGRDAFERDHASGVDVAGHHDGRAFAGELVDDVEELERPAVGRLVELEVEGPEHIGPDRAHGPDHHAMATEWLLALAMRDFEAFGAPEALYPLVVDPPTLAPGDHGRPSPSPART